MTMNGTSEMNGTGGIKVTSEMNGTNKMKGTIETGIATNQGIVGILRPHRTSWSTAFNTEAETEF